MTAEQIEKQCIDIADKIVPQYRNGKRSYSCHGTIANKWGAAYYGAYMAITGNPHKDLED